MSFEDSVIRTQHIQKLSGKERLDALFRLEKEGSTGWGARAYNLHVHSAYAKNENETPFVDTIWAMPVDKSRGETYFVVFRPVVRKQKVVSKAELTRPYVSGVLSINSLSKSICALTPKRVLIDGDDFFASFNAQGKIGGAAVVYRMPIGIGHALFTKNSP